MPEVATSKPPVFHGRYRPSSRIILRSTDGQRFAVSRFFLTKNSTLFASMFELPRPVILAKHHRISSGGNRAPHQSGKRDLAAMKADEHLPDLHNRDRKKVHGSSARRASCNSSVSTTSAHVGNQPDTDSNVTDTPASKGDDANVASVDQLGKGSKKANESVSLIGATGGLGSDDEHEEEVVIMLPQAEVSNDRAPIKEDIEVDADWQTLALFLDLLQIAQFPKIVDSSTIKLDLTQCQKILPMAKMYDCRRLLNLLDTRLRLLAAPDPWGVLSLASNQNDLELARCAISLMDTFTHMHHGDRTGAVSDQLWKRLDTLQPSWQLALLRAMGPTTSHYSDEGTSICLREDFHAISHDFDPSRYESIARGPASLV